MAEEPVNNIYRIPVWTIHFMQCLGDEVMQGRQEASLLAEGDCVAEAVVSLSKEPGYANNYNDLSPEERRGVTPFRFGDAGIEKVLFCDRRFKNQRGEYTCGMPVHDIEGHPDQQDEGSNLNGEFGFCCIDRGCSIPEAGFGCPYAPEEELVTSC
ncbi:MAG: hypothetical protein ABIH92_03365 [Nanoarchaeota archaeon]